MSRTVVVFKIPIRYDLSLINRKYKYEPFWGVTIQKSLETRKNVTNGLAYF